LAGIEQLGAQPVVHDVVPDLEDGWNALPGRFGPCRTARRKQAAGVAGRVDAMTIDPARRVQSLYVPVSDGVRLAVDVWLPVEGIARSERIGTAFRATRYHRAEQPPGPEPEVDSNHVAGA